MHKSAEELFAATLELADLAERAGFLGRECAGNAALRAEVESLLAAHGRAGAFLNTTEPTVFVAASVAQPQVPSIPDHELLRPIGQGSYGQVWLARNIIGTYRAIKIVHRQSFRSERPFEREFAGIQKFEPISRSHSGFVAILHVGRNTEAACFYSIMELADDQVADQKIDPASYAPKTLASELRKFGHLPSTDCVAIALTLTSALGLLHRHGLIHRDIKPANIIIVHDLPKLADIGLVAAIGEAVTYVGTDGYLPPEGPGAPQADLYALGKVLYEMSTGKDRNEFPNPPTRLPEYPDPQALLPLNEIIFKACHADTRKRFQSAAEMHNALSRLQSGMRPAVQLVHSEPERKSVAVLPFVNMNADADNEFLSDGITEDLTTALAQVKGLRVAGRTSAFSFKGKAKDLRKIAGQLGVEAIVEGSVRKAGCRLRITAQLINAADGCHVWSERYDRDLSDVFTLQDEISKAIVEALKLRLVADSPELLVKPQTTSTDAYQLYLKGRYFWNQRAAGLPKGLHYFELAVLEDPQYALAYTGIADSLYLLGIYGYLRPKEACPRAKAAAMKALELDDSLAEAHSSLGFNHLVFDWDWPAAAKEFQRALELNPNYVPARYWRASYLSAAGQHEEAIAEVQRALKIDPLSVFVNTHLGWSFFHARQYDRAEEQLRRALELAPDFLIARWLLGRLFSARGQFQAAIAEFQKLIQISADNNTTGVAWLGHTYAACGQKEEARRIIASLQQRSQQEYVRAYLFAVVHAGLGETERVLEWLERAYEERDVWMGWLKCDPIYDGVHTVPRFAELIRRIGMD